MSKTLPIGELLVQRGTISAKSLATAVAMQEKGGGLLFSRLLEIKACDERDLVTLLAERLGLPGVDLSRSVLSAEVLGLIPRAVAETDSILALSTEGGRLHLAATSPSENVRPVAEVRFVTGLKVSPCIAIHTSLRQAITEAYAALARGEKEWRGAAAPQFSPPGPAIVVPPLSLEERVTEDLQGVIEAGGRAEEVVVTIEKEHAPPDPALSSKRILVVDDDPEIRLFVCRALEHRGYGTDTAADGKAALAMIREKPPDLLVLDAMLPLLHGFELCRQLKGDERTRAIPIIMVTAVYRGWRFAQDTRETYGADYYLEKPFHLSDLLSRVESALGTPARQDARRDYAAERCRRGVELFQAGHIEQALAELDRAAKDDPFSPACHYYLALALSAHGDDYAAMTSFERAVELRPNLFPALRTLASIYVAKGFRRKAIESYERALRVAPDEATHAQIKEELLALI